MMGARKAKPTLRASTVFPGFHRASTVYLHRNASVVKREASPWKWALPNIDIRWRSGCFRVMKYTAKLRRLTNPEQGAVTINRMTCRHPIGRSFNP